jgi:cytoskeletal protein CcmA (bactofilin family)
LIIRSTGRVNGNASYGEIEIERGGLVQGAVLPAKAAMSSSPVVVPVISKPVEPPVLGGKSQA